MLDVLETTFKIIFVADVSVTVIVKSKHELQSHR